MVVGHGGRGGQGTGVPHAAAPAPAAPAGPQADFEANIRYGLIATRAKSPGQGGTLAACLALDRGKAIVIGVALQGGAGPPNDVRQWDGISDLHISGTTLSVLAVNWFSIWWSLIPHFG